MPSFPLKPIVDGEPPFLGTYTTAEIALANAEIAAGSMAYVVGSSLVRAEDSATMFLQGPPGAESFTVVGVTGTSVDAAGALMKTAAAAPDGATKIGTSTGDTVEQRLAAFGAAGGSGLVGWSRNPIAETIDDVALWLNAQPVNAYELAGAITDKPNPADPTTWDWTPVFVAAEALPAANAVQLNLPAHAIKITDTITLTRGVIVRGQGLYRSIINFVHATKYAINFVCPSTRYEYFELRGVTVNSKYGLMTRWDNAADISNVANPFRSIRIKDCRFVGTYDPTTDALAGTTTVATVADLLPLGVGLRLVMAYGAIVEGCLFEKFGIALGNWGCTLSKFQYCRANNNARHIHDERVAWYASSFGMGADNEYTGWDLLDGRRLGAVTFSNSYGAKFRGNYLEHLDRGGALSSATLIDCINPSHLRMRDNHLNASLSYTRTEPFLKFRSAATAVDATNNIIEDNCLTPFDNVSLTTVDMQAEFHQRYPQVLVYKNNQNWPILYQANVMDDYPREDTFSAINLHHKSKPGGAAALFADLWQYDSTNRQYFIKNDPATLEFNLGCDNPDKSTKIALVFDVDDIAASGGNGRQWVTVTDEDGTVLVNSQVITGVVSPQKFTVVATTALPYTHKRLKVSLAGTHLLKTVSVRMEPLREIERRKSYTPGLIAAGTYVSTTVTVPGAVLGDFAMASFNQALSGVHTEATVDAADTVTVKMVNQTAGGITPAAGLLSARVVKR